MIKNSQPFGKKFQKTVGGIFFDSHCTFHLNVQFKDFSAQQHCNHLSTRLSVSPSVTVKKGWN